MTKIFRSNFNLSFYLCLLFLMVASPLLANPIFPAILLKKAGFMIPLIATLILVPETLVLKYLLKESFNRSFHLVLIANIISAIPYIPLRPILKSAYEHNIGTDLVLMHQHHTQFVIFEVLIFFLVSIIVELLVVYIARWWLSIKCSKRWLVCCVISANTASYLIVGSLYIHESPSPRMNGLSWMDGPGWEINPKQEIIYFDSDRKLVKTDLECSFKKFLIPEKNHGFVCDKYLSKFVYEDDSDNLIYFDSNPLSKINLSERISQLPSDPYIGNVALNSDGTLFAYVNKWSKTDKLIIYDIDQERLISTDHVGASLPEVKEFCSVAWAEKENTLYLKGQLKNDDYTYYEIAFDEQQVESVIALESSEELLVGEGFYPYRVYINLNTLPDASIEFEVDREKNYSAYLMVGKRSLFDLTTEYSVNMRGEGLIEHIPCTKFRVRAGTSILAEYDMMKMIRDLHLISDGDECLVVDDDYIYLVSLKYKAFRKLIEGGANVIIPGKTLEKRKKYFIR